MKKQLEKNADLKKAPTKMQPLGSQISTTHGLGSH
jgi:hypothetical protein